MVLDVVEAGKVAYYTPLIPPAGCEGGAGWKGPGLWFSGGSHGQMACLYQPGLNGTGPVKV